MTGHDTLAVLAHHLRGLDTDARAALVADLWAARGFETSREGREVVATGRGGTVRIRVDTVGASADPPDVLVASGNGRGVREVVPASVRVVDAEGLAGMLRYAVDRSTAAALCERHLGAPPDGLHPPVRERLRTRLGGLRAATDRLEVTESPVASASFLAAGLVLLAVSAVAGVALTGVPGSPSTSPDTGDGAVGPLSVPESTPIDDVVVTPTPTANAEGTGEAVPNASVVPGLSEDGIVDLSALAAAHARTLLGGSYTLWIDTYRPPEGDPDGDRVQFDTDVAVAGDRFLVEENVGDGESRERLRTVYDDGEDWYVANETANGTTYARARTPGQTPPSAPNPDNVALRLVADYLSTPETTVEGHGGNDVGAGGDGPTYRLVGRGTPPTMDGDGIWNYTAVALVDRDGLVRDLTVTYTVISPEGSYRVRKEWTYGYLGETTVAAPAWYVERFGANATATPGTPDG